MALSQRFSDVTCDVVHVSSLEVERKYPIVKAERIRTRYGETVLLSIRDHTLRLLKVFLSKRKAMVFKDEDIMSINEGTSVLDLVYEGQCDKTKMYILATE
jgi:fibrillarin-like rRNA methylase